MILTRETTASGAPGAAQATLERSAVALAPGPRRLVVDFDSEFGRVWWRAGERAVAEKLAERIRTLAAAWSAGQVCIAVTTGVGFRGQLVAEYAPPLDVLRVADPRAAEAARWTCSALDSLGWPVLGASGFEAADICATLAAQAAEAKQPLVVLSSDRRAPQVLRAGAVTLARSATWRRGVLSTSWLSAAQLLANSGLRPDQWADRLTLLGLNLPGCGGPPHFGAATVSKLLQAAGTLESLLGEPWKWCSSPGQSASLAAFRPQAATIAQLVTLRTDAPVIWTTRGTPA